jgi:hypothetical protein
MKMEDLVNKQIFRRLVLLGAAIVLIVASTASVVQAASLCVNPGGSGGCYDTIQAAVDAASDGDEIIVRAGMYVEQVTIIDKDLTLVGREGAVVQAPIPMEQTLLDATGFGERAVIGVANAEVAVRNLTIDGANSSADNEFLVGIAFFNAGGVIHNNLVRNVGFGEPTLPIDPDGNPLYQGDPIFAFNGVLPARTVTISRNRIINYNDIGIIAGSFVDPEDPASMLTAHILNNTIVGLGANDVIDQWGMSIFTDGAEDSQAFTRGTIRGNRVRDMITVDPFPFPGVGIFTFGIYNMQFTNNVVQNSNDGFQALRAFNMEFWRNRVTGIDPGRPGSSGLVLVGSDNQVTDNRFREFDAGILLLVEDEFLGSALNTVLDDNRFQNVAADVMTTAGPPPASAAKVSQVPARFLRYRPVPRP